MKKIILGGIIILATGFAINKVFSISPTAVGPLEITEQDKDPDGYPAVLVAPSGSLSYDSTGTTVTLNVAMADQINSTYTALLGDGNTNYVNVSGSTQTKTGGLNLLGSLGLGTTNPASILHLANLTPSANIQGSSQFLGPRLRFKVSGGSVSSSTIVTEPDYDAGAIYWDAHDGTEFKGVGAVLVNGDGSPTSSSLPTAFNFLTTSPGATNATLKANLNSTGDLYIHSVNGSDTGRLGLGTFSMASGAQLQVARSSFVVMTAGNVGIGTNSPSSRLDVLNGSITARGTNAGIALGTSSFYDPTTLTVAGRQIFPAWYNNINASTAAITALASTGNYVTILESTQTKVGGFTVNGTLTSSQDASFGNISGSSTTVLDKIFVKQSLRNFQEKGFSANGDSGSSSSDFYYGWAFNPRNITMQVTHLGYYASSLVSNTREVAIFTTDSVKLASVYVSTNDAQSGFYRYQALSTPLTLSNTNHYVIIAEVPGFENRPQKANAYDFNFSTNVDFVLNKSYAGVSGVPITSLPTPDALGTVMFAPGNFLFQPVREVLTVRDGNVGIGTTYPSGLFQVGGGSLTVLSGGNVGIGTASPGNKLEVQSAQAYADRGANPLNSQLQLTSPTGGRLIVGSYFTGGSGHASTIQSSDFFSGTDHGTSLLLNPLGGNVGIGTTNPSRKLTVSGGSSLNDQLLYLKQANEYGYSFNIDSLSTGKMFLVGVNNGAETSPIMTFDRTNTYVGIGTTSPLSRLHVQGPANDWTSRITGSATSGQSYGGLFSAGSNSSDTSLLVLDNSGTNTYFKVRGDGSVGIGTNNPGSKLEVNGNIRAKGDFPSGGGGYQFSSPGDTDGGMFSNSDGTLDFYTDNSPRVRINSSGSVGIGTTNPGAALDVKSNGPTINLTGTDHTYIQFYPDGAAAGRKGYLGYPAAGIDDIYVANEISGADIILLPNGGNVGIGTTAPAWKLHVHESGSNEGARLQLTNADSGVTSGDGFQILLGAAEDAWVWNYENTGLHFGTNSSERMTILSGGNVGIGTTNPAYKLELSADSAGKPTTNTWTITSDSRTKEDISEYTAGLNEIKQIRPITFTHNGLGGTKKGDQGVGVLAQEMRAIFPQTVSEREKIFESTDDVKGFDATQVVISSAVIEKQWTVFNEPQGLMQGTTFFQRNGKGNAVVFKNNDFYYLFKSSTPEKYLEVKNTSTGFVYEIENGTFFSAQNKEVEVKPVKHGYKASVLGFNSHEVTFALINAVKELSTLVEGLNQRVSDLELNH